MQVGLKIWRFNARSGERELQEFEIRRARGGDAARLPRHRQGPARRLAGLSQELPNDDLRLLRHAHGRRRGARLQGAHVRRRERRSRPGHLGDGQPPDRQGPRRRHEAVLGEVQERRSLPAARLRGAAQRQGVPDHAGAHERRSTRKRSASTAAAASRSATRWSPTRASPARKRWRRRSGSSATRATARRSSGSTS